MRIRRGVVTARNLGGAGVAQLDADLGTVAKGVAKKVEAIRNFRAFRQSPVINLSPGLFQRLRRDGK